MSNILITGGQGFIGSHLSKELVKQGNRVISIDNNWRGKHKVHGVINIKGSVLDYNLMNELVIVYNIDKIVHLAAVAGIFSTTTNPVDTFEVIFKGAENVMKIAVEHNIKKVVIASTSEIYGELTFDATEDSNTAQGSMEAKRWTYAVSKLAADHLASAYKRQYGLDVTSVRFFNVYGPGQIGEGAISIFIKKALNNEDIVIFNDGFQIRAWCYVGDLIDCLVKTLDNKYDLAGKAVNIGNPMTGISVYELALLVKDIAKSKSNIIHGDGPDYTEIYVRVPNIDRAKRLLGFYPKIDLREGIKKTIEWVVSTNAV